MLRSSLLKSALFALCCLPLLAAADPALTITADNPGGVAAPGQKVVWHVAVSDDPQHTIQSATYVLKKGGAQVIGQGSLSFGAEPASIETTLDGPGTVLAEINAPQEGKKPLQAFAGAAFAPQNLPPSAPAPDDFDAFWKSKIAELTAVPENPVLAKGDSGKEGVDYWKITLDNIRGTHIQGQLARPATGEKFPAMLIVQWAGVYPLQKEWATNHAREGWIVLNINAHDLPIDEPKEFYDEQAKNALKDYTAIGNEDRETSYFVRMFLSCYRAAEYLAKRPDWDGKTLIVAGTSQGGLQSFVTAGLDPKITGVLVLVPAGCDNTGALAGRKPGWPYWQNHAKGEKEAQIMQTSRYFDAVNFAARIHCPTLIGLGLIDITSPPSGVYAAANRLKGPKEIVVLPDSPHQNVHNAHAPFYQREAAWRDALVKGQPAPVPQ